MECIQSSPFIFDLRSRQVYGKHQLIFRNRHIHSRRSKLLAEETKIMNSAVIAFDDEKPMRTNTVTNTIQSKEKEEEMTVVQLYPNPVNDVAFIRLEHRKGLEYTGKQIVKADVFDLNGARVLEENFSPSDEVRIDLSLEIKGYYLLRVTDSENKAYTKKMLVKFKR